MKSGRFIAVVGPSGVGKDSVMEAMSTADKRLKLVRRVITRPSDSGGEAFDGVSVDTFEEMRGANAFALSWQAHGLFYGIPRTVHDDLMSGVDLLANLSRGVLSDARALFDRFEVISLTASHDVLKERLLRRGRESEADIDARLRRAKYTIPESQKMNIVDNSGMLDDTVNAALATLYPERV